MPVRRFNDVDLASAKEMKSLKKGVASPREEDEHRVLSPIVTNNQADKTLHGHEDSDADEGVEFSNDYLNCCRALAPIFSSIIGVVLLVWLVMTSGTYTGSSTPKVAILIFEGLRGDIFQNAVIDGNKAPFLKSLLQTEGSAYSTCTGVDDTMCARTQSGTSLGAAYTFGAAPGITSILTGVNSQRHLVANDSVAAMSSFATSSKAYPSLPMYLKSKGYTTAAVGTAKLLTTLSPEGTCTAFGVLDYECGVDIVQRCFRSSACNLDERILTPTSTALGEEENNMAGGIADALATDPTLLIFHTSKLSRGAADANRPNFAYDTASQEYLAELYQLDAVIGQLVGELRLRSQMYRENWLLIGTSAHGGLDKKTGTVSGWDEIIPFFVAPVTSVALRLNALSNPASQMDVYPTALKWLGLEAPTNVTFDGQLQGICTDGSQLSNCTN